MFPTLKRRWNTWECINHIMRINGRQPDLKNPWWIHGSSQGQADLSVGFNFCTRILICFIKDFLYFYRLQNWCWCKLRISNLINVSTKKSTTKLWKELFPLTVLNTGPPWNLLKTKVRNCLNVCNSFRMNPHTWGMIWCISAVEVHKQSIKIYFQNQHSFYYQKQILKTFN